MRNKIGHLVKQPIVVMLIIAPLISHCGFIEKLKGKRKQSNTPNVECVEQITDLASPPTLPPELNPDLRMYQSCEELQTDLANERSRRRFTGHFPSVCSSHTNQGNVAPDMASSASRGNQSRDSQINAQFTNIQELGVDEADHYKVGRNHIFISSFSGIKVVNRISFDVLGDLPHPTWSSQYDTTRSPELYVDGDRLIVLSSTDSTTTMTLYDATNASTLPNKIADRQLAYAVNQSRMVNGHVVTVGNIEDPVREYSSAKDGKYAGVSCTAIARSPSNVIKRKFLVVSSINTRVPELPEHAVGAFDGSDQIYMTQDGIYSARSYAGHEYKASSDSRSNEFLVITKIVTDKQNGALSIAARGAVPGRTKDQWAFQAYSQDNALAVATTTGQLGGRDELHARNHLWILQQNGDYLKIAASIRDFAPNEEIRAVRYVNQMAYVVTFRSTDPLFAFDLSNPLDPKKVGELKIPGFSTYMHPVAEGRLLGVGFDAIEHGDFATVKGIQVSLFDTTNPAAMTRLDNHIHGQRGDSSEVTSNHHAFYFEPKHKLVGIPMTVSKCEPVIDDLYSGTICYGSSGAMLYRLEEDRLTQVTWLNDYLSTVDRLFTIDDRLVTVSQHGIKVYDFEQWAAPIKTVKFE